jgi:hypothetical protein
MRLDYTLLDPDIPDGQQPLPAPDPRDWAEHCESCERLASELASQRRCHRDRSNEVEIRPTDDAPLSALEPFGVDTDLLGKLDGQLFSIHEARLAVARPGIHVTNMAARNRSRLAQALTAADRWLAKNPPNSTKLT